MSGFVENSDLGFVAQLNTFREKIGGYAATLGLLPAEVVAVNADADYMAFVVLGATSSKEYVQAWTSRKDRARKGTDPAMGPYPAPVDVTTPPADVVPGIETRFRALVARIKANPNYTNDIGKDLGIVDEQPSPEVTSPELSIKLVGTDPVLSFKKGATDGIRLYSKRGSEASFSFLATDTQSPYVDNRPNVVLGTPEKREYHAFYFKNDAVVGVQGPTISITV